MELRHKEMLSLLRISNITWKKAKDKKRLFNKQGFELVEIKKVGRSNIYIIKEPQLASEQLKRLLLDDYDFSVSSNNLLSFSNLLLLYWQQGTLMDMQLVSDTLGISQSTIYRWRKQMQEKGLINIVSSGTIVLYYSKHERVAGTEKDWMDWLRYVDSFPVDSKLKYSQLLFMYQAEKGFFPYKTSTIKADVIKEDIFKLIYELTQEIEIGA